MNESRSIANPLIAIFAAASELPPGDERRKFLDEACGGDTALRAEVEQLLNVEAAGAEYLKTAEATPSQEAATIIGGAQEKSGELLGAYKLLEPIGEGGFGTVWVAEQQRPLRRRVALKILKPGMDSRQVLARFEAERQALAIMDHPNIATVHDGGVSVSGRPFFVMELVKGVPITEFCDQQHLPPRERLDLFLQVCHAVQHAHQKGIIHRDLKPSNILVAMHDTRPVVKVIDFGIAKALGQELTDQTLFTGLAQMIGTPLYMSPEQAGQSSLDVDTRSDIYSLGVLLYELLTGATPFARERFKEAAYDEIRRIIREEEPPKPSTRLSESKDSLPSISALRDTAPDRLTKLVRGELDWIVMKALEKDRSRRYETANGFALDVQRYLANEPVLACPPSTAYRLRKFVRRHRGSVTAASLILITLTGGIVGTTIAMARAGEARRSEAARAETERKAKEFAILRDSETKAIIQFFEKKVFFAARPDGQEGGLGHDVTLRRAIEAALPQIESEFPEAPLIQARLHLTMAQTFHYLGEPGTAGELFRRAASLFERELGPLHQDTLLSRNGVALSWQALGRYEEAISLHQEILALRKSKVDPDPDTLITMNNLGGVLINQGRYAEALPLFEEVLAMPDGDRAIVASAKANMAACHTGLSHHAEAARLREEVREALSEELGPGNQATISNLVGLSESYVALGRYAEALTLCEEAVAGCRVRLPPGHPLTSQALGSLAGIRHLNGDYTTAVRLNEEALSLQQINPGSSHPLAITTMSNLARSYSALGRHMDAVSLAQKALLRSKSALPPGHIVTAAAAQSLADCQAAAGQEDPPSRLQTSPETSGTSISRSSDPIPPVTGTVQLRKTLEDNLELVRNSKGPDAPETIAAMIELAAACAADGSARQAIKLGEEALTLARTKLPVGDPRLLAAMKALVTAYHSVDLTAEAKMLEAEIEAIGTK